MASRKGRNSKAANALAAANAADGIPERITEAQGQVAVLEPTPKRTAESKRGKSTVENPVAVVWVMSHNACVAARAAGEPVPARKDLQAAAEAAGVSFYTARTQVQAYLKASKGGTETPSKLPRNVTLS